jgi:hypothetical protein
MAWWDRLGKLPTRTLNGAAGVAALAGLFALGVGIGSGCTLLLMAAFAVIFPASLVPAVVDCRDAKRRHVATVRPKAMPAATGWRAPGWDMGNIERETGGGRLVWIEPEADRKRLH